MRLLLRTILASSLAAFMGIGSPIGATNPAYAQSCTALKAQLAAANRGGDSAQFRRYNNAFVKQQAELARATGLYRSACGNRPRGAQCHNLAQTIQQMRSNLVSLQAQRDRFAGQRLSRAQRYRLSVQIERACSGRAVTVLARRGDEPRRPTAALPRALPSTNAPRLIQPQLAAPGYRTLCVRKTDGYYFPISHATAEKNFARDAAICKATCPNLDVELFTHPLGDENGPQNMVSLNGEAYIDRPNAFAYRDIGSLDRAACGAPDLAKLKDLGFLQQGDKVTGTEMPQAPAINYPTIRPRPEQTASLEVPSIKLDDTGVEEPPANDAALADDAVADDNAATDDPVVFEPPAAEPVTPAERNVRVVLPELLPDPTTAIDLEARDPSDAP
ncbi:MAG: DUF2865 domain-containing protein [Pseudomonadota bacterium]